jgi:hypothetical protein
MGNPVRGLRMAHQSTVTEPPGPSWAGKHERGYGDSPRRLVTEGMENLTIRELRAIMEAGSPEEQDTVARLLGSLAEFSSMERPLTPNRQALSHDRPGVYNPGGDIRRQIQGGITELRKYDDPNARAARAMRPMPRRGRPTY